MGRLMDKPAPTPEQIAEVNRKIDAVLARVTAMYVVRKAREQAAAVATDAEAA